MRIAAKLRHHSPEEIEAFVDEAMGVSLSMQTDDVDAATIFTAVLPLIASAQVLVEQPQAVPVLLDGLRTPGH